MGGAARRGGVQWRCAAQNRAGPGELARRIPFISWEFTVDLISQLSAEEEEAVRSPAEEKKQAGQGRAGQDRTGAAALCLDRRDATVESRLETRDVSSRCRAKNLDNSNIFQDATTFI